MNYNGRFLTILTVCAIIYSFYYYNKDNVRSNHIYDSASSKQTARYSIEIDPERTDLAWYEKLIIKYAKRKKQKEEAIQNSGAMRGPHVAIPMAPKPVENTELDSTKPEAITQDGVFGSDLNSNNNFQNTNSEDLNGTEDKIRNIEDDIEKHDNGEDNINNEDGNEPDECRMSNIQFDDEIEDVDDLKSEISEDFEDKNE